MNHNAYFIKNAIDTAYRNLETYFALCTTSVSEVKGFLEVGEAKNIIVEDYDDDVQSQILLPADGVIVYKDVDFSIKLAIEGNSSYKVNEQMNQIIAYFEKSPTIIKDNYRMHGNKVILLGWQPNEIKLNSGSPSASELLLLNLKFKKVFSSDIPFLNVVAGTFEVDHTIYATSLEIVWGINGFPTIASNLFVEHGFYIKKSTDSVYTKYVSEHVLPYITKTVTGLTTATTYNVYPFVTTKLETIVGAVENITTL